MTCDSFVRASVLGSALACLFPGEQAGRAAASSGYRQAGEHCNRDRVETGTNILMSGEAGGNGGASYAGRGDGCISHGRDMSRMV